MKFEGWKIIFWIQNRKIRMAGRSFTIHTYSSWNIFGKLDKKVVVKHEIPRLKNIFLNPKSKISHGRSLLYHSYLLRCNIFRKHDKKLVVKQEMERLKTFSESETAFFHSISLLYHPYLLSNVNILFVLGGGPRHLETTIHTLKVPAIPVHDFFSSPLSFRFFSKQDAFTILKIDNWKNVE